MPRHLENLIARADELVASQDDYDGLIKVCTEILELAEDNANKSKACYRRGLAYNAKGDYDKAIAITTKQSN